MEGSTRIHEYEDKISGHKVKKEELEKISFRYSIVRLILVLIMFLSVFAVWSQGPIVTLSVIFLSIMAFLFILKRHEGIQSQISHKSALIEILENEINVCNFKSNLYYNGSTFNDDFHLYTGDLDIYGQHSLYEQLNRCKSYQGNMQLHHRLSSKGAFPEVKAYQEATKELIPDAHWRQDYQSILWRTESAHDFDHYHYLFHSLQLDTDFAFKPWIKGLTLVLPVVWLVLGYAAYVGWPYASSVASAVFIIVLMVYFRSFKKISAVQSSLTQCKQILSPYADAVDHITGREWNSSLNQACKSALLSSDNGYTESPLKTLGALLDKLDYRLNFIVGTFLNLSFFWDFYIIRKIKKWQDNTGHELESIFDSIGYMELVTSLATYAYNHKNYTFPSVTEGPFRFSGLDVKHPLIHPKQSVGNDISFHSEPGVRIITGSNMSGKSTLLRTLGTHMVLAYAGTVCSGTDMEISHQDIFTYMRIKDALEENVSTFKAELNRIKLMLDRLNQDNNIVLLIDEMLRGTNSKDKLKGSISITQKLIDKDAQAFIATHDLQLAEYVEQKNDALANYFFDISFQDGELEFDYKLKEGICSNFNASFLLAQMGI